MHHRLDTVLPFIPHPSSLPTNNNNSSADVKAKLDALINGDGLTIATVNNDSMGGDPAPGKPKQLKVGRSFIYHTVDDVEEEEGLGGGKGGQEVKEAKHNVKRQGHIFLRSRRFFKARQDSFVSLVMMMRIMVILILHLLLPYAHALILPLQSFSSI